MAPPSDPDAVPGLSGEAPGGLPGGLSDGLNWQAIAEAPERRFYLAPAGLLSGAAAEDALAGGQGLSLAGGAQVFTSVQVLIRGAAKEVFSAFMPIGELRAWIDRDSGPLGARAGLLLESLTAPRLPFAGVPMNRPSVMGVLNVTPDSFSDGGMFFDHGAAIAHGRAMLAAGADFIDVGGESTRPGADPVPPEEQIRRILPVIRSLAEAGAAVSVDTRSAQVMAAALESGATVINDVTALSGDPEALTVASRSDASVVLMHMQHDPRSMQVNPEYRFAPLDVLDYLLGRLEFCRDAGMEASRICVDPGIGFGKTLAHNVELLGHLAVFHGLGAPVMLGVSRKSFIRALSAQGVGDTAPPDARERLPGSLAAGLFAVDQGVQILRVHDVAETVQALSVWQAVRTAI